MFRPFGTCDLLTVDWMVCKSCSSTTRKIFKVLDLLPFVTSLSSSVLPSSSIFSKKSLLQGSSSKKKFPRVSAIGPGLIVGMKIGAISCMGSLNSSLILLSFLSKSEEISTSRQNFSWELFLTFILLSQMSWLLTILQVTKDFWWANKRL